METSERLIRSTIYSGLLRVHRILDQETRDVGDLDLVDYLILSRAVLTPVGAPMRKVPDELDLPVDLTTAKCAQLERDGYVIRTRDQSDRRAFSLSPTGRGKERYDLITDSLNLRLRTLWSSLPESAFDGILETMAGLLVMPGILASTSEEFRLYRAIRVVHRFAQSCFQAATYYDLTIAAAAVLLLLDDMDNQQTNLAGIPSRLGMQQTTVLPTLSFLEEHDLVTHNEMNSDSYSVSLLLTPDGKLLCTELKVHLVAVLAEKGIRIDEESAATLASISSLLRPAARPVG